MIEHKEYEPSPLNQKAKRVLALAASYICTCVIAGAIFSYWVTWLSFAGPDKSFFVLLLDGAVLSIWVGVFVSVIALIPSIFVIIIAERKGWHHLSTHVFFGALIGVICFGLLIGLDATPTPYYDFFGVAVNGGIGGAIYWFLVGRKPSPFEKLKNEDIF